MRRSKIRKMVLQYTAAAAAAAAAAVVQRHGMTPGIRPARILGDIKHRYHHKTGEAIGGIREEEGKGEN